MSVHTAIRQMRGFAMRPALSAGGARKRGRGGCGVAVALLSGGAEARAQSLPSGQSVDLQDVIIEEISGRTIVRFRFLAPAIARDGGTVQFAQAERDMELLCEAVALPYLSDHAIPAQSVVISLADREVEFGVANPEATQFFEAYSVEDGICVWEGL